MGRNNNRGKLASRLSFNGSSSIRSVDNNTNKRLSYNDARINLTSKTTKGGSIVKDARELLVKKQQQTAKMRGLFSDRKSPIVKSKEPLMIVTGLANVRKEGDKLKIIKRPTTNFLGDDDERSNDHRVISNGKSTLITLTNNRRSTTLTTNDNLQDEDNDQRSSLSRFEDFKSIKIKIDNDIKPGYISRPVKQANEQPLFLNKSSSSKPHYNDYEESMEYESVDLPKHRTETATASAIDHILNNNGFKVLVSNLHSKVTEDDILELFSDIGPIKRARFLEKGLAEVVYVKLEHAKEAIYKYDKNELDGKPMKIELISSTSAGSRKSFPDLRDSSTTTTPTTSKSKINSSSKVSTPVSSVKPLSSHKPSYDTHIVSTAAAVAAISTAASPAAAATTPQGTSKN